MENGKIRMKYMYILFIVAILSPAIRVSSTFCASQAGHAGWVSIIISGFIFFAYILFLNYAFKNRVNFDLYEAFKASIGTAATNIICTIYFIWNIVLASFYLKTFALRYASSLLSSTPVSFFIITILSLAYLIVSGKLSDFSRLTSIYMYGILLVLIFVFTANIKYFSLSNILPVTTLDTVPIIKGLLPINALFTYFTALLFLGDKFAKNNTFVKKGFVTTVIIVISNLIIFFSTVGVFGSNLTEKIALAFFMSIKTIRIFDTIGGLESIFIIFWSVTDVIITVMFFYIMLAQFKKMYKFKSEKIMKAPLLLAAYPLSLYIVKNVFEVIEFSNKIAAPINIVVGYVVPVVVLLIGKVRKTI